MNILFVLSHPDDEAYGPAGTIAKLSQNNSVHVISLCMGNRPGSPEVYKNRQHAFSESCSMLGVSNEIFSSSDLELEYKTALKVIEKVLKDNPYDIVYTHNISDLHKDHRVTAEAVLSACRPQPASTVKKLYMCEIPSSTHWAFNQFEPSFEPNSFVDITEFINLKKQVMNLYATEIKSVPDARSIDAMINLAKFRGNQIGTHFAESFKLIFSRE